MREAHQLHADANLLASGANVAVRATCPQHLIAILIRGTTLLHVVFVAFGHQARSLSCTALVVPTDFSGVAVTIDGAGPLVSNAGVHAR